MIGWRDGCLEAAGYACTRAAASLGVFDIVGVSPTNVVLVQCKTRDWPGAVEMDAKPPGWPDRPPERPQPQPPEREPKH